MPVKLEISSKEQPILDTLYIKPIEGEAAKDTIFFRLVGENIGTIIYYRTPESGLRFPQAHTSLLRLPESDNDFVLYGTGTKNDRTVIHIEFDSTTEKSQFYSKYFPKGTAQRLQIEPNCSDSYTFPQDLIDSYKATILYHNNDQRFTTELLRAIEYERHLK